MAEDTPEDGATEAAKPARRGAPTLAPPSDPALAGAVDAFVRGDYRAAAADAPDAVADVADDRAWSARLHRALTWEPALWVAAAACGAVWLWAALSAQSS